MAIKSIWLKINHITGHQATGAPTRCFTALETVTIPTLTQLQYRKHLNGGFILRRDLSKAKKVKHTVDQVTKTTMGVIRVWWSWTEAVFIKAEKSHVTVPTARFVLWEETVLCAFCLSLTLTARWMVSSICHSVGWSTSLVRTEISQELLNVLQWSLIQIFIWYSGYICETLVTPWIFFF